MNELVVMTLGEFVGVQVSRNISLEDFFKETRADGLVRLSAKEAAEAWLLFPWSEPPQVWRGPKNLFTGKTTRSPDGKAVMHEVIELRMQMDLPLGARFGFASWVTAPNMTHFDVVLMKKHG